MANVDDPFFTSAHFCWMIAEPDSILPVRNQGRTDICYAYPVTATMYADQILQFKETPSEEETPSEGSVQEFMDNLHTKFPPKDFDGVVPEKGLPNTFYRAFRYVKKFGLYSKTQYPYVGRPETFRRPEIDPDLKIFIGDYEKIRDQDLIMKHLNEKPLTGSVPCVLSFMHWGDRDEVYQGPTEEDLALLGDDEKIPYHALTLIGYGDVDGGDHYYICQNSYGPNWGHKGYIKVRRDIVKTVYLPKSTATRRVELS